ncbi:phytanoyl-CoA dioxygenase family protein [Pseudomonas sp. 21LCFQ010]|uniref:phytanoyl-CoA dioxygenase family protein n=1 Tax=Pseudomonas sp. 21LCFQ010 TaxID=2957506 RepID=UPI00209848C7|nr:phytanoyl-CoA dioxygenase family protein [Pseudomonas sp. 21LCFQ010]MCO8163211.1 phytanoyl-CoA dioxygenase family protein [Pseudomonas sp. 21LCFQ010]
MITTEVFDQCMAEKGWVIFEQAIHPAIVEQMREDIHKAYIVCRDYQIKNGIDQDTSFTVHHLLGQFDSFLDCLQAYPIYGFIERYFAGQFILNSFGGAINTRDSQSYAQRVHRDIRSYSGEMPLLLNTLVMLDDFTADNGATWMLSGSHKAEAKPDDEYFKAYAEQAIAPAGSILMFNSNVWHAGGSNLTDQVRRSVTPMFSKPFMKQQFDYPRAIGYDRGADFDAVLRQVIGYNSRVPATLDEWYQPPAKRMYHSNQG